MSPPDPQCSYFLCMASNLFAYFTLCIYIPLSVLLLLCIYLGNESFFFCNDES
uniref:Uncharacterized protein n=1 Tax=Solanum lycopersicum TaxID=4081 RepID=A0A3Q7HAM0_SOLLC